MNPLTVFLSVGFLLLGITAFAVCLDLYKTLRNKPSASTMIPANAHLSPGDTAKRMVGLVCTGHFLMHILTNNASKFDDGARLTMYKTYIRNPSVIAYISNVKGCPDYE